MYDQLVCWCGSSAIGMYLPIYKKIRAERVRKVLPGVDPRQIQFVPGKEALKMGDVLDALGIHTDCCRSSFITSVTLADVIYKD